MNLIVHHQDEYGWFAVVELNAPPYISPDDFQYLIGEVKPHHPVPVTKATNDYYWRCCSILWYLAHFGRPLEWRKI